jgi:hypothetical protein
MKSYEVLTNAYVNEVRARNDLPDYLHTMCPIVKWK